MRTRLPLETLLQEAGLLSQKRLDALSADWTQSGLSLPEYLVRHQICREEDIAEAICRKTGIQRYLPAHFQPTAALRSVIPVHIAQAAVAVPLGLHGEVLHVAMVNPQDSSALDSLEHAANCEIEAVLCLSGEFSRLFGAVYGLFGIGGTRELALPPVLSALHETPSPYTVDGELPDEAHTGDVNTDSPETSQVTRLVNAILVQAVREGASDIHISPERSSLQVRFRIDGKLHPTPSPPRHLAPAIISRIKIMASLDISTTRIPQDGRFTTLVDRREIDVRVSCLPTIHGENVVLRLLDMDATQTYTLDSLGMDAEDVATIQTAIHRPNGLILSTGPTGSGKSTSLHALLQQLNTPDTNIITLEDPVEYRVDGIRQVLLSDQSAVTFTSALRAILRQDPDIIMIGEIRDPETARIAVQAAFTGHLVLATLHANDAPAAITRLREMAIEPFYIASVLLCTFAQRLVRTVCPHCAKTCAPPPALLRTLGITDSTGATFKHGTGCYQCRNTGYLGRTGLFEVMPITPELETLILDGVHSRLIGETAVQRKLMRTLAQDAVRKVRAGRTTVEEVLRVVPL